MSLKREIKKAINQNTRYTAIKVWKPEYEENMAGEGTLIFEVSVKKKSRIKKSKKS
jgi:hypothetical protein